MCGETLFLRNAEICLLMNDSKILTENGLIEKHIRNTMKIDLIDFDIIVHEKIKIDIIKNDLNGL
jgi:hypothetical protein